MEEGVAERWQIGIIHHFSQAGNYEVTIKVESLKKDNTGSRQTLYAA